MKKAFGSLIIGAIFLIVLAFFMGKFAFPNVEILANLPKPEVSEGERGQLGIDKNVNESTIDKSKNMTITGDAVRTSSLTISMNLAIHELAFTRAY